VRRRKKKHIEKRVGKPESVGSVLDAFLREAGYAVPLKEWEAVLNWERIAGEYIAQFTECDRVENGVLYVKVKSSPLFNDLWYMKDDLKSAAFRETGCETIKDIKFY